MYIVFGIVNNPYFLCRSPHAAGHLQVLNALLAKPELGSANIASYLLTRGLYPLLSQAIHRAPRNTPSLPPLITISTTLFSLFSSSSTEYTIALTHVLTTLFSIPLLPSHLPGPALAHLSARVPFAHIPVLDISGIAQEARPHLLATLHLFVAPRYKLLPPAALANYFTLVTGLLNGTPTQTLNPAPPKQSPTSASYDSDSDSDGHTTRVSVVSTFTPALPPPPKLDPKTLKRLSALPAAPHIATLLTLPSTLLPTIAPLIFALSAVWPLVPGTVLAHPNGATLVRQVYRGWVRGGRIGREGDALGLNSPDPGAGGAWVMLLALTDLYTKALVTMGDDEFFGTSSGSGGVIGGSAASTSGVTLARNPLTLDELTSFSRQLLNIAFALYWREDVGSMGAVGGGDIRCSWEGVREKVTKCLVGIHARE
jgi:ubiquitin-protein ligase E3 C